MSHPSSIEFQSRFSPDSDHKHYLVFVCVQSGLAHPFTFSTATQPHSQKSEGGARGLSAILASETKLSKSRVLDSTFLVVHPTRPDSSFFHHILLASQRKVWQCFCARTLSDSRDKLTKIWLSSIRGAASTTNFLFDPSRA